MLLTSLGLCADRGHLFICVCNDYCPRSQAIPLPTQGPPNPLEGTLVEWEGWKFRWQFREIEGLILTDVHFQGRKVLKAISLAEIYVPYAPGWPRPKICIGRFQSQPNAAGDWSRLHSRQFEVSRISRQWYEGHREHGRCDDSRRAARLDVRRQAGPRHGKMLVLWCMVHFPALPMVTPTS